jgi:hypothetical protein
MKDAHSIHFHSARGHLFYVYNKQGCLPSHSQARPFQALTTEKGKLTFPQVTSVSTLHLQSSPLTLPTSLPFCVPVVACGK